MEPDLSGTTVLVTGVCGRLGRLLVPMLRAQEARVVPVDAPGSGAPLETDLTDEAAVETLFDGLDRPLDAVIHTVGMWDGRPLAETDLADFRQTMDVNLTSAFLVFREAVRHFLDRERPGRLVALASKQGTDGGVAEQAAYSAAKAGVVRLVEATHAEYARQGIHAAAVAPSMILFGREPEGTKGVSAERVAALCAYLASPAGADHSGSVLRAFGSL